MTMSTKTPIPSPPPSTSPSGTAGIDDPGTGTYIAPGSGTAIAGGGTAVASGGTAIATGGTAVVNDNGGGAALPADRDSYRLGKLDFKVIRRLSSATGEASVLLAENGGNSFAIKLYRPGHRPDDGVIGRLCRARGNGLTVDVYDHGVWHDPDDPSGERYYEVQRYYPAGGLEGENIRGNEQRFREIALNMASAIDFCHSHRILHRDIKPANFLYADDSHRRFVLADFGIARGIAADGRCKIDSGRTPVYAAPECYISIDRRLIDVDRKSDYYAMGMSLLALWIGEDSLRGNERELIMKKQNEALPYPDDMSPHSLSLIKALTRRDIAQRADFATIKRWAAGETVFDMADYHKNATGFRIIFNSSRNQIAQSPAELAAMMWNDQTLAIKYLYSGTLKQWFMDLGRPETAVEIDNIAEELYPHNHRAGLYAVCLLLNPDMPFTGVKGNSIVTPAEIAAELWANASTYKELLASPDALLYVYMRSCGLETLAGKYPRLIARDADCYFFDLIYTLDSSLPYPVKDKKGKWHNARSVNDIIAVAHDPGLDAVSLKNIMGDDFTTWLSARDKALAGKVADTARRTRDCWATLYALAPAASYNFVTDANAIDYLFTPAQLAEEISREMAGLSTLGLKLTEQLGRSAFDGSRLYRYLESKGKYDRQISWVRYCKNLTSTDNAGKIGPYNDDIATYKVIRGWGGSCPYYPAHGHGRKLLSLADVDSCPSSVLSFEKQRLADWLTGFFQENPSADYKRRSYSDLTGDYYDYLVKHLPDCNYIARSSKLAKTLNTAIADEKRAWKNIHTIQWLTVLLCFIPMLATFVILLVTGFSDISRALRPLIEASGHYAGIALGVIGGLASMASSRPSLIGAGIVGLIIYGLTVFVFKFLVVLAPWLLAALLAIAIWYFGRDIFISTKKKAMAGVSAASMNDTVRLRLIGEAFGTTSKIFKNTQPGYLLDMLHSSTNEARSKIKKMLRCGAVLLILSAATVAFNIFVTPTLLDSRSAAATNQTDEVAEVVTSVLDGSWTGTFDGVGATMTVSSADGVTRAKITISYSNPLRQTATVKPTADGGVTMTVISSTGAVGGHYDATLTTGNSYMTGKYINPTTGRSLFFQFSKKP